MTPINLYDRTAFDISKVVTKKYSTSFYTASRLFDRETREAIFAIYGFVRVADEIVDTFDREDKAQLLENFESEYREAYKKGISLNPVLQSFQIAVKKYDIPQQYIDAFLKSMKLDLYKKEYQSVSEMEEYIHGSADVVGLMCLKVFTRGNQELFEALKFTAQRLGSAFQTVNFLRDLKNDLEELERSYFPAVNPSKFDEGSKNQIIQSIHQDFTEALKGIRKLPINARLPVYVAFKYYTSLLRKIERTHAREILSKRIRISNGRKTLLLAKAYVEHKMNILI